jgi:hypothetical protein
MRVVGVSFVARVAVCLGGDEPHRGVVGARFARVGVVLDLALSV